MNDESALVSIIMPARNAERYLARAIRSLLAQSYPHWELWLVDDGSTDGTVAIASMFDWPTIHILQPDTHLGTSAARNLALQYATGDFLLFLDADDELLPCALQGHIRQFRANPSAAVVYSDGYFCTAEGRPIARLSDYRPGHPEGDVLNTILVHPLLNACNCSMLRRSCLVEHGLVFDPDLEYAEDWDLFVRLAALTHFIYLPELTCLYRLHSGSSTLHTNSGRNQALAQVRQRNLLFLSRENITDSTRFAAHFQLLFEHFVESPERQLELLASPSMQQMAPLWKARLFRLVAANWIVRLESPEACRLLLARASELDPSDRKGCLLRSMYAFSPGLTRRALLLRRLPGRLSRRPLSPFVKAGLAPRMDNRDQTG